LKKVESYHVGIPDEHRGFINPKAEDHGTKGPLHLSYAGLWEKVEERIPMRRIQP
jgi:hypothetical protein